MIIYSYIKEENHKKSDTERLIAESYRKYCGEKTRIVRNEYGKPYLACENVFVGVTHTENLILIAFSEYEFGIDCEKKTRKIKNSDKLLKKYFTEEEVVYCNGDNEKILEIWVKKEAYIKFLGTGFKDVSKAETLKLSGFYEKIESENYIIYVYSEEKIKNFKKCGTF